MKIDIDKKQSVTTLGDVKPGDVFQFDRTGSSYYMRTACGGEVTAYFVNLSTGKVIGEMKTAAVRLVPNVRLTNK